MTMSFNHLRLVAQPFKKLNENRNGRDYILAGNADALEFALESAHSFQGEKCPCFSVRGRAPLNPTLAPPSKNYFKIKLCRPQKNPKRDEQQTTSRKSVCTSRTKPTLTFGSSLFYLFGCLNCCLGKYCS